MKNIVRHMIARQFRRGGLLLILPGVLACLSADIPSPDIPEHPAGGHHVLLIGNSLTYTNNLPGTVVGLAKSAGDTIRASSVALPNFALIDHALGQSNANDVIKSQAWEYVILQQGPTTVGVNRDTLILATKMFDPLVRAAGGRIAELMSWPNSSEPHLFNAVRLSFQAAATSVETSRFRTFSTVHDRFVPARPIGIAAPNKLPSIRGRLPATGTYDEPRQRSAQSGLCSHRGESE